MCWYCHWGWPKRVSDIYDEAIQKLGGYDLPLICGPGHVVWGDQNWSSAEWCLEEFEKYARDLTAEQAAIVRWSLEELVKIPLAERDPAPDCDEAHDSPEKYPPADGVELVKDR